MYKNNWGVELNPMRFVVEFPIEYFGSSKELSAEIQ